VALLLIIALTQEFILRLLPKKQKKQLTLYSEKQAPAAGQSDGGSVGSDTGVPEA